MKHILQLLALIIAISFAKFSYAGDIVLSITGAIGPHEKAEGWEFDIEELQKLPSTTIDTTTIWTEGLQSFEGVSLATLLNHVQSSRGTILAIALNDYAVKIPTSDAIKNGPIIAYKHNGREMSVRDRGPLWVIYPYDENKAYQSEEYYSRSIWQLDRIEILEHE